MEWRNLPCPQINQQFQGIELYHHPLPNIPNWQTCASNCFQSGHFDCKYWQYIPEKKECSLIKDFSTIQNAYNLTHNIIIGPRDCPGDPRIQKTNYGMCPEGLDSKSIWLAKNDSFFSKDVSLREPGKPSFLISHFIS